eukprot:scaffold138_cov396-Prasinococcus_capsulatus_cf.AAC.7
MHACMRACVRGLEAELSSAAGVPCGQVGAAVRVPGGPQHARTHASSERASGRTDGRTDGWVDGWMDGWMDGCVVALPCAVLRPPSRRGVGRRSRQAGRWGTIVLTIARGLPPGDRGGRRGRARTDHGDGGAVGAAG